MSANKNNKNSQGGNSFLTIKSGNSSSADDDQSKETTEEQKPKKKKPPIKKKSEEEKIQEFTDKVSNLLEKIESVRVIARGVFQKRFSEAGDRLKLQLSKGKLKFLKPILPVIIIIQKINETWFQGKLEEEPEDDEENKEKNTNEELKKPVTFVELAEKNIIFTDNKKRPLYTLEQLKGKNGYTASEEIIAPIVIENIIKAFLEVAPKAKAIPTPEKGKYANIPMSQVMENIDEEEIMSFLEYVRNFPRGYVGKSYRITESFAGWAVSGTPDN